MCRKIRCDRESWKLFGFRGELNKASSSVHVPVTFYYDHVSDSESVSGMSSARPHKILRASITGIS